MDSVVTGGVPYFYVVTALVGCSESSNSLEVTATPLSPIPPPPRTEKLGNDHGRCGCSTVSDPSWPIVAGLLALLLVLMRRYS